MCFELNNFEVFELIQDCPVNYKKQTLATIFRSIGFIPTETCADVDQLNSIEIPS